MRKRPLPFISYGGGQRGRCKHRQVSPPPKRKAGTDIMHVLSQPGRRRTKAERSRSRDTSPSARSEVPLSQSKAKTQTNPLQLPIL